MKKHKSVGDFGDSRDSRARNTSTKSPVAAVPGTGLGGSRRLCCHSFTDKETEVQNDVIYQGH